MKEKLYNLIVNNHNLELLESKLNTFNPFDVLKIANYEIRHSNVLEWLLNPKENHGFKDVFLKKITSQIILENENLIGDNFSLLDIHLGDFGDSLVRREEKNIDILVVSNRNNFLLLIENKIHAKENPHQLSKYLDYANKEYEGFQILPVFLTKFGYETKNKNYAIFSHDSVHKLIKETLALNRKNMPNDIVEFVEFYLKTLERTLNMNEELHELCQKIYSEHKEAIDLIVENVNQSSTHLLPSFKNFIKNHKELKAMIVNNKWLWFLPKQLENLLPEISNNWNVPYPIAFWISKYGDTKITFHIEIGPFKKGEARLKFIQFLETQGYDIRNVAKRLDSKYTRIHTSNAKIKDWSDTEELSDTIERLYQKSEKEITKIINAVTKYQFNTKE